MKKILSLTVVLCACLFTACSKDEKPVTTEFKGEHVVSSSYAKEKFKDKNTILVHVKKEESNNTIDSSVNMEYDYLTKSSTDSNGEVVIENILDNKELSKKLGALGLDKNKEIILFANDNSGVDGKILYQLLLAGYDYVKIVDGGYDSLINAGFEEGSPKKLNPIKININEIEDNNIITDKELKDNYEDYRVVSLDKNTDSDLEEIINLNYDDLFSNNKTLKSIKEIKKLLKDLKIKENDEIVVHSSDGIKSAYVQVILEMSGFKNAKYYDEAYSNNEKPADEIVEEDVEEDITEEIDEDTNDVEESTTTKPNTNQSTNGSTGSTNRPGTNGSTGSTNRPGTNGSTGSTNRPGTGGSTGSTNRPGTGGSSGSTTPPSTDDSTDSTTPPETGGSSDTESSEE